LLLIFEKKVLAIFLNNQEIAQSIYSFKILQIKYPDGKENCIEKI
jgi:hypothetical protein